MTFVNAHWLETLTGLEPDGGSGISEWTLTLGCVVFATVFALARLRLRVAAHAKRAAGMGREMLVVRPNCGSHV